MITTLTDRSTDLTTHKVTGDINSMNLLPLFEFLEPSATRLVLWDLRGADYISSISSEITEDIVSHLKDIPVKRGGKSAFVFSSQSDYGIGRTYETYAKTEDLPFALAVFQSMEEASAWLGDSITIANRKHPADD